MAEVPHCGHARNGGALAQGRIPFVLEADLQSQEARRETTETSGDPEELVEQVYNLGRGCRRFSTASC